MFLSLCPRGWVTHGRFRRPFLFSKKKKKKFFSNLNIKNRMIISTHTHIYVCRKSKIDCMTPCRELTWNFQPVRNKKIEKNTHQRKKITCTRQYLRGSTICLCPWSCRDFTIIREKYKVWQHSVSVSQKWQQQTLITKIEFSTSCAQDSQWATKWAKTFSAQAFALWTKPQKIFY